MTEVYLNNRYLGTVDQREAFVEELKDQRRKCLIPETVSFSLDAENDEIKIESSEGRALPPKIEVTEGKPQ